VLFGDRKCCDPPRPPLRVECTPQAIQWAVQKAVKNTHGICIPNVLALVVAWCAPVHRALNAFSMLSEASDCTTILRDVATMLSKCVIRFSEVDAVCEVVLVRVGERVVSGCERGGSNECVWVGW
jgi:hypothetical protein